MRKLDVLYVTLIVFFTFMITKCCYEEDISRIETLEKQLQYEVSKPVDCTIVEGEEIDCPVCPEPKVCDDKIKQISENCTKAFIESAKTK